MKMYKDMILAVSSEVFQKTLKKNYKQVCDEIWDKKDLKLLSDFIENSDWYTLRSDVLKQREIIENSTIDILFEEIT